MNKYEFVPGDEITIAPGRTVKRIRALAAIAALGVTPGALGGYVESEKNVSQVYGDAWVYGDARVYGDAQVYGNARVYGDAQVYGNAWVYGNAQVYGELLCASRSDGYLFICCKRKEGPAVIIAGCRYFSFVEARAHWKTTRNGTKLGEESMALIDHLERMAKIYGWAV